MSYVLGKRDEDLTEKEFSRLVYELADSLGWHRYHTYRSERSQPGYPDETLVRDRVIWLELKTEKGRLSEAQEQWVAWLINAGGEVYVVRPRHLQSLAKVLAWRSTGAAMPADVREAAAHMKEWAVEQLMLGAEAAA